jgi:hypothetical protein
MPFVPITCDHESPPLAIVVFDDNTEIAWLRLLKRGFRHCLVLVGDGEDWVLMDPVCTGISIALVRSVAPEYLVEHFVQKGQAVAVGRAWGQRAHRSFPLRPLSCVEVVKHVLGISAAPVWTPYQLYRHLVEKLRFADQNPTGRVDSAADIGIYTGQQDPIAKQRHIDAIGQSPSDHDIIQTSVREKGSLGTSLEGVPEFCITTSRGRLGQRR